MQVTYTIDPEVLEWLAEVKRLAAEFRRAHDASATLVDSIENKLIPALRDAGAGL